MSDKDNLFYVKNLIIITSRFTYRKLGLVQADSKIFFGVLLLFQLIINPVVVLSVNKAL